MSLSKWLNFLTSLFTPYPQKLCSQKPKQRRSISQVTNFLFIKQMLILFEPFLTLHAKTKVVLSFHYKIYKSLKVVQYIFYDCFVALEISRKVTSPSQQWWPGNSSRKSPRWQVWTFFFIILHSHVLLLPTLLHLCIM